jgi:serine protease Do
VPDGEVVAIYRKSRETANGRWQASFGPVDDSGDQISLLAMINLVETAAVHGGRLTCMFITFLLPLLLWQSDAYAGNGGETTAGMIAKVMPAVVRILTVRPAHSTKQATGDSAGVGAGYIIDPSGDIGTNKHLIVGATSVFVITADGERYRASIVGTTAKADIALLRIDPGAKALPFVRFGDSDKVQVGDQVTTIGSPLGLDNTVTSGIISAINRDIKEGPFDDYLQTDAAINHGNSGGPLFNAAGEVVGMTSVIFSPDPGSSGLGFAIPSNSLQFVFDRLIKTGKIGAGMLPLHTQPVTWGLKQAFHMPDLHGALVTSVDASDIKRLGNVRAGDVITTFNGQPILDPRDLARKIARSPIDSDAVLELRRGNKNETVHVTIEALPEAKPLTLIEKPRGPGLVLTTEQQNDGESVVRITSVDPASTAAEGGVQKGDILVQVEQTPVSQSAQASQALRDEASKNQQYVAVLVRHNGTLSWLALEVPE